MKAKKSSYSVLSAGDPPHPMVAIFPIPGKRARLIIENCEVLGAGLTLANKKDYAEFSVDGTGIYPREGLKTWGERAKARSGISGQATPGTK